MSHVLRSVELFLVRLPLIRPFTTSSHTKDHLDHIIIRARDAGANSIVLNAREDAQQFYDKHGFSVVGPAPTIFGAVKHVRMRKDLLITT